MPPILNFLAAFKDSEHLETLPPPFTPATASSASSFPNFSWSFLVAALALFVAVDKLALASEAVAIFVLTSSIPSDEPISFSTTSYTVNAS